MEAKCCIVSELQGLKVGQNGQSGPFGTFGSHVGQHFARFDHGFYFQKCSPWWALSAQPIMGGVLPQTDRPLDGWHRRVTCRLTPCEQQGTLKSEFQSCEQITKQPFTLHYKFIEKKSQLSKLYITIASCTSWKELLNTVVPDVLRCLSWVPFQQRFWVRMLYLS